MRTAATLEEALSTVEDDPLAAALLLTLASLEETLTAAGWDQPPVLLSVIRYLGDPGEPLGLAAVPMPKAFPESGGGPYIAYRIQEIAATIAKRLETDDTDMTDLHAWVLASEGWMAAARDGDEVARKRLRQQGEAHLIHTRPDRVEVRMLTAVDRSGMSMQLVRQRDGKLSVTVQRELPADKDGDTGFTGTIPEALTALMEATS
jgi:hypothetical protein